MTTGLSANTFKRLLLDAGVFLKNFEHSEIKTVDALKAAVAAAIQSDKCFGATRGGGSFVATPTVREVEADGKRAAFVGSTHIEEWEIKLNATLLEFTADNVKTALGAATATKSGSVTEINLRSDFDDSDYIDTVCWIGDTSEGFAMIEIDNALSVGGINLAFADKNEGTLPIELTAHQASLDDDTIPARIYLFDAA